MNVPPGAAASSRSLARTLRDPFGAALAAEPADGVGDGVPDLTGAGRIGALQRRYEKGVGPDRAEVVCRWLHRELLIK
jgi:hypothetical protein